MTQAQMADRLLTIEAQAEALRISAATMRKEMVAVPKKKKGLSPADAASFEANLRKCFNKKTA